MNLRKVLIVLVLCFAAKAAYAGPTPRATVQSFLVAARAGNFDGFARCIYGGEQFRNIKPDADGIAAMKLMFRGARITRVETVSYIHSVVYVKIYHPVTGESEEIPMDVKKINGDWKIYSRK